MQHKYSSTYDDGEGAKDGGRGWKGGMMGGREGGMKVKAGKALVLDSSHIHPEDQGCSRLCISMC